MTKKKKLKLKMKMPKKVNLYGDDYPVFLDKKMIHTDNRGTYNDFDMNIKVSSDIRSPISTLFHEIAHVIFDQNELRQIVGEKSEVEMLVQIIGLGFYEMFQNNLDELVEVIEER